jgi:hypothetical protein
LVLPAWPQGSRHELARLPIQSPSTDRSGQQRAGPLAAAHFDFLCAGRRKGAPNKATAERQAAIAASGETPLDYMIQVMRDQNAPVERRDEMAKAAAPHVHPRLAAVEYAGTNGSKPANEMSDEELMAIIREGQAKEAEERKLRN